METGVQCETLTNWRNILSLREAWNGLLARSRCNRAFNSAQWYFAVPLILPELSPLLCVARRAGTMQGILPLWRDQCRQEVRFADHFCDHIDIIAADDDREAMTGLLAFAIEEASRYGPLSLRRLKRDSNCVRAACALGFSGQVERGFAAEPPNEHAVIDLGIGYDAYLKRLSRKFRLNLNRMRHKAAANGLVVRELQPEDLAPEHLPATFLSLHAARFGEASKLVAPSGAAWIQHLFPSLFGERRLRAFAVLLADRITGIDLAMVSESGLYAWNGGFLPEVQRYDPGKLLIDKTIQQCCAENFGEYDLAGFGQQYKAHWRPAIRRIGDLQFGLPEYQTANGIVAAHQKT
jgi:CelD/BcsL family acetyltransferase involved in cellulose biosynthesis